jgi:GTP cyclohydrolase II
MISGRPELNAVSRVIGDLRRGMPVVLDGGNASVLVCAAESGGDPQLLYRLSGQTVSLLIPASRARTLGLDPAEANIVSVAPESGLSIDAVAALIGEAADDARHPQQSSLHMANASDSLQAAAVELVKLARLLPAALVAPVTDNAAAFARREDLLTVTLDNIGDYRRAAGQLSVSEVSAQIPLEGAENTRMVAFRPADGGKAHFAIIIGNPDPNTSVLVRLHSECFTGDLLGSLRCDCGDQLRGAVAAIAAADGGILLYLAQEGRGIGLTNKLRAYRLQDNGFDTLEANEALGFGADERVYAPAAQILQRLGFTQIRLMTNNPAKMSALTAHGIEITARVPHAFPANGHNEHYLQTKAARGGHLF